MPGPPHKCHMPRPACCVSPRAPGTARHRDCCHHSLPHSFVHSVNMRSACRLQYRDAGRAPAFRRPVLGWINSRRDVRLLSAAEEVPRDSVVKTDQAWRRAGESGLIAHLDHPLPWRSGALRAERTHTFSSGETHWGSTQPFPTRTPPPGHRAGPRSPGSSATWPMEFRREWCFPRPGPADPALLPLAPRMTAPK